MVLRLALEIQSVSMCPSWSMTSSLLKIAQGFFGNIFRAIFINAKGEQRDVGTLNSFAIMLCTSYSCLFRISIPIVLKVPKRAKNITREQELRARREELTETLCWALLASKPKHLNVVTFIGICMDVPGASGPCQVLTYHTNGSLSGYLKRNNDTVLETWKVNPQSLFDMVRGIVASVAHLHENQLIHGDLKLDNIVVTHDGRPCVSDLGKARKVGGEWPQGTQLLLDRMPPEFLFHRQFDFRGDVWMLGLLLLDVFRRRPLNPFKVDAKNRVESVKMEMGEQMENESGTPDVHISRVVATVFPRGSNIHTLFEEVLIHCLQFSVDD